MTIQIIRPADRAAWLAARTQDVTASVAGALFGVDPYSSPYELWAEKTGRRSPDGEPSDAMERGILMEPVVVKMVQKRHPAWAISYDGDNPVYYRDPETRIGATPDAFVVRPDRRGTGIMQIKSVSEDAFEKFWETDPDTGAVIPPTWIAIQAIVEATLTKCPWACVAVVVLTRRGTFRLEPIIDIPLDNFEFWERLVEKVKAFWEMIAAGRTPDPDWDRDSEAVLDVLRQSLPERLDLTRDYHVNDLAGLYVEAKATETEQAARAGRLRAMIIHALGTAEIGETERWFISARTSVRGDGTTTRVLRIKPRENLNAGF
ncbi:hypothetical protein GGQ99_004745 [Aminobacter niigataensis]|uniref:YqaJ viral recombinase domain-containing protein n=1 Tax=Aminobacter niigataensis TaxID=83265 RepID=A0ABR6L829_9HYPH|nr:YqaJ viral recombinase family protein [Aminobacter niigataensis]MBB4652961.1 hypothetical protein [Aminobacter niigataensis]